MQLHTDNKFSLLSIYNTHTGWFLFSESHSFNQIHNSFAEENQVKLKSQHS
jgi:hypothetical protein